MVAYATFVNGSKIGSAWFLSSVSVVRFNEKRQIENVGLLGNEACCVG